MTIKNRKTLLSEDFLSDQEPKPITADQVAGTPENVQDDDFSDLLGDPKKDEEKPAETSAAEETAGQLTDAIASLKDVMSGVALSIQKLNDKMDTMAKPEAAPEGDTDIPDAPANVDLDLSADAGTDEAPAEGSESVPAEGSPEGAAPAAPESPAEGSNEEVPEDKPDDGGEAPAEAPAEENDNSQDESAPGDEQKSEAYRMNKKAGKLLNSNTGSIIGIVESGKLYKLDEMIMTAVKAKIRARIDEAKKALKSQLLSSEVKQDSNEAK